MRRAGVVQLKVITFLNCHFSSLFQMSGKGKGKRSRSRTNDLGEPYKNGKKSCAAKNHVENVFALKDTLLEKETMQALKSSWESPISEGQEDERLCEGQVSVISRPFKCCSVKDFLKADSHIEELMSELQEVEFFEKNNDLYKFKQSADLKSTNSPTIASFRKFLSSDVKSWLQEVTSLELDEEISLFCARYDYTDYLLCHDDELEGRLVAFIYYLVPPSWREGDGGSLDLFNTDDHGRPREVVKSLYPSMNSFAFFQVTPESFHQVAEVLTRDKTRLSVGGWFLGRTPERLPKDKVARSATQQPNDISEEFYSWINPLYLDEETQSEIRENFSANSEISLPRFLSEEKFEKVSSLLRDESLEWSVVGPANQRQYGLVSIDSAPAMVRQCQSLLTSDAMFLLLSTLTGLQLHPLAPDNSSDTEEDGKDEQKTEQDEREGDDNPRACSSTLPDQGVVANENGTTAKESTEPRCRAEFRRWRQGSYTLVRDDDTDQQECALDARLFFNCRDWTADCGGFTSYVARDEDEELLSAFPEDNALNIVYRDTETLKFVKRVTDEVNKMPHKEFHDLSVVYYE